MRFAREKLASERKIHQSRNDYYTILRRQLSFELNFKFLKPAKRLEYLKELKLRLTNMNMDVDLLSLYQNVDKNSPEWKKFIEGKFWAYWREQCKLEQILRHDPQFGEVLSFLRHKAALETVIHQNRLKYLEKEALNQ